MQYISKPPRWLSKKSKTVVTLNEYNGRPTQALISQRDGALALWRLQGFSPEEPLVHALVHLSDDEAQAVYDAGPDVAGLLEPVWKNILDNRVVINVEEPGEKAVAFGIAVPRAYGQKKFIESVVREASISMRTLRRKRSESAAHKMQEKRASATARKDGLIVYGQSPVRLLPRHIMHQRKNPMQVVSYGRFDFVEIFNYSDKSLQKATDEKSFNILAK